jgi:hypothetical protein
LFWVVLVFGLVAMDQLVPFHDSMKVWSEPLLPT